MMDQTKCNTYKYATVVFYHDMWDIKVLLDRFGDFEFHPTIDPKVILQWHVCPLSMQWRILIVVTVSASPFYFSKMLPM